MDPKLHPPTPPHRTRGCRADNGRSFPFQLLAGQVGVRPTSPAAGGWGGGVGREDAPHGPAPAPLHGRARDVGDVTAPREEPPPYCLE